MSTLTHYETSGRLFGKDVACGAVIVARFPFRCTNTPEYVTCPDCILRLDAPAEEATENARLCDDIGPGAPGYAPCTWTRCTREPGHNGDHSGPEHGFRAPVSWPNLAPRNRAVESDGDES